ncbi:DUF6302 family protein [Streptomyces griseofuscus]|uniref:Uncharacterized protein n=1 Tax=Streptomyces griseofuscus TaxID=146922 RepID=A0A7H1Q3V4_9ACTN|nr:DUF6302 family protein [Streptomyces griseofuscus]QNT94984.1 hypothetical protein HEP81_04712 [Streptomyces griseofuscus]
MKRTPTVEVRPPDRRDEWAASWYRERLDDPTLLDAAVVLVLDGPGSMAVPSGGRRLGGYLSVDDDVTVLRAMRDALDGREGFPHVRVRLSEHPEVCHRVEWGPAPPECGDHALRGRFYGYSEQAIVAYVDEAREE